MNYPMMKPRPLSVAEFRELEANAPDDERWELINGRIVKSIAGGTLRHNKIVQNVAAALRDQLRRLGSQCETFTENVRLDLNEGELSTLPDVVVTCNPPPDDQTALVDAAAIVEVLSPSTAATDLNEKLSAYLKLPGLGACVFIEQAGINVVSYAPSKDGWLRREMTSPQDILDFPNLGVSMTVEQIYDRVDFRATMAAKAF